MIYKDPLIKKIPEKRLIGIRLEMSLAENRTAGLWKSFMPKVKEINHKVNSDLFSVQIYNPFLNFKEFTPTTVFEKWAAVLVKNINTIPDGMESFVIPEGKYAVFIHRGTPDKFHKMSQFIFKEWLPNSKYQLDDRPHFEIMDVNYRPNDPNAEETVWIPVC